MQVFWITFLPDAAAMDGVIRLTSDPYGFGCGITARDSNDALALLREYVFPIWGEAPIDKVVATFDMDALFLSYPDSVREGAGNFLRRGIWYPIKEELPL